jgi:DNA-binding NtrC family response regulator
MNQEKNPKLLIIDDEEFICEILSDLVMTMTKKLEVISATSVEEALKLIPKADMIIADINMPHQEVLEDALKRIHAEKPVARMSGNTHGKANYMIEKPFRHDQVAQTLQFLYVLHRENKQYAGKAA